MHMGEQPKFAYGLRFDLDYDFLKTTDFVWLFSGIRSEMAHFVTTTGLASGRDLRRKRIAFEVTQAQSGPLVRAKVNTTEVHGGAIMRKMYLSLALIVLGGGMVFGAIETIVGNRAMGNAVGGWFLGEILGVGLGGAAALVAGVVLLFQSLHYGDSERARAPAASLVQERQVPDRVSWSAYAFLILILLLVFLYVSLVLITSGIQGVLLQLVFWVPIVVVGLFVARWWYRARIPEATHRPPSK
jgi:hypothetical protein